MPTVKERPVEGFAHCNNARCPGNAQQPVEAVEVTTEFMYRDNGANAPGVEKSVVELRFADDSVRLCPHCGRSREVTDTPRVVYDNLSGLDPMGLLGVPQFDPKAQAEARQRPLVDEERAALERQLAEAQKQLAELAKAKAA